MNVLAPGGKDSAPGVSRPDIRRPGNVRQPGRRTMLPEWCVWEQKDYSR